jgi:hypothetical protein
MRGAIPHLLQHAFMAWCLVKHRVNFTFTLPGVLSLGVKRSGREADHSPPSSAEVKECVELYLHSPNMSSWTGTNLPLNVIKDTILPSFPSTRTLPWFRRITKIRVSCFCPVFCLHNMHTQTGKFIRAQEAAIWKLPQYGSTCHTTHLVSP